MQCRAEFSKSADIAEQTLNALVAGELGRWEHSSSGQRGGRPSAVFVLVENQLEVVMDIDSKEHFVTVHRAGNSIAALGQEPF